LRFDTIPYEDITFWPEMQRIFEWTKTNVHSTTAVCWRAMAAPIHFHGVPKHKLADSEAWMAGASLRLQNGRPDCPRHWFLRVRPGLHRLIEVGLA